MPLDLTKKENDDDPMAQQRRADGIARERRIENEFNEKHGIKTPEDAERFIQKCKDEIFAKLKFKKIPDAPKVKTTDKEKPSEKIYADEEYFEGKKYRDTRI